MTKKMPLIYNYTDYREFLRDYYISRKKENKKFSHRFIAFHIGTGSSGWFSDIINRRINLTKNYITKLCSLFQLHSKESEYFEILVNYCQASSLEEKMRYYQKILTFKEVDPSIVHRDQFEFYSKWYISVIRELLFFYDFTDNYQLLAKKLDPPIRIQEAKEAMNLLLSCGLIKKNENGFFKPVDRTISKDNAFRSIHWAHFATAMMKLAINSVYEHNSSQRDISSVTIGLSAQNFKIACKEIASLRKKLLVLSEQDNQHDSVYQCNIQLFPLTRSQRANNE